MKRFHFAKNRTENYQKHIIDNFGGEIINENLIRVDSDVAKGEIMTFMKEGKRLIVLNYIAKCEIESTVEHEDKFDYSLRCYGAGKITLQNENESIKLNFPLGFIISKKKDILTLNFEKNQAVQSVFFFFKKSALPSDILEVIEKQKKFSFNLGDQRFIRWKKSFFVKNNLFINDALYTDWVKYKLRELFVIIKNIILTNASEQENKTYHDYEITVIMKIKKRIDEEEDYKPNIKELTIEYGINKTKINAVFRFVHGETIYQYYKKSRVFKAKELVKNTLKSLSEIADAMGYTDTNHMAKDFNKHFKVNPTDLRNTQK